MTTAVRRITFCAGHRLMKHEGHCAHLHGHNYVVLFHAQASQLDPVGRVIDFSVLKRCLGGWIETHWDHGFICCKDDRETLDALSAIPGQKLYVLDENPTAENLARHLLEIVAPSELEGTGVRVVRIQLWETENCHVEVSL
jgi:6-pyruvoyltetrahydropterin/6-carboxytetrahydropterin synthase